MQRYRIVVRGELSERMARLFEGMALEGAGENSALVGPVRDQSHLHGLIARVSDVGLELVSVNAVDEPSAAPTRAIERPGGR